MCHSDQCTNLIQVPRSELWLTCSHTALLVVSLQPPSICVTCAPFRTIASRAESGNCDGIGPTAQDAAAMTGVMALAMP